MWSYLRKGVLSCACAVMAEPARSLSSTALRGRQCRGSGSPRPRARSGRVNNLLSDLPALAISGDRVVAYVVATEAVKRNFWRRIEHAQRRRALPYQE
jgi:hypothetical protein